MANIPIIHRLQRSPGPNSLRSPKWSEPHLLLALPAPLPFPYCLLQLPGGCLSLVCSCLPSWFFLFNKCPVSAIKKAVEVKSNQAISRNWQRKKRGEHTIFSSVKHTQTHSSMNLELRPCLGNTGCYQPLFLPHAFSSTSPLLHALPHAIAVGKNEKR